MTNGVCQQPKSVLYGQETWTEGYCPWWDAFDLDVALLVLAEDDLLLAGRPLPRVFVSSGPGQKRP
jgi:hypothetical protein